MKHQNLGHRGCPRTRQHGRLFYSVLLWSLLVGVVLLVLLTFIFSAALQELGSGVHVSIDGRSWDLGSLQAEQVVAAGAVLALTVVLVVALVLAVVCAVVPLALLIAALGIVVGLASTLLAVGSTLLLALSPVLLIAALLWLMLRRPRGSSTLRSEHNSQATHANMNP